MRAFAIREDTMRQSLVVGVLIFVVVLVIVSATSHGDPSTTNTTITDPIEPIPGGGGGMGTGPNAHGHRQGVGLPASTPTPPPPLFAPTDPGPADALWSYNKLSQQEQAVIDRNNSQTGWDSVNNAFGAAVKERAGQAAAQSAALQLGISNLGNQGVVP
jgi:hypothetical protein